MTKRKPANPGDRVSVKCADPDPRVQANPLGAVAIANVPWDGLPFAQALFPILAAIFVVLYLVRRAISR